MSFVDFKLWYLLGRSCSLACSPPVHVFASQGSVNPLRGKAVGGDHLKPKLCGIQDEVFV